MIIRQRKVDFAHRGRLRNERSYRQSAAAGQSARVPRISRLMALAIRFDGLIRDGIVADRAELARLGHVTPARLTQIMNLLQLAPDIQESLLFLQNSDRVRDETTEKCIRPIAGAPCWQAQRQMWRQRVRAS